MPSSAPRHAHDAVDGVGHNEAKGEDGRHRLRVPLELLLDELAPGRPVLDVLVRLDGQVSRKPLLLVLASSLAQLPQALSERRGRHGGPGTSGTVGASWDGGPPGTVSGHTQPSVRRRRNGLG